MLSRLFRSALYNKRIELHNKVQTINGFITAHADEKENDINPALVQTIHKTLNNCNLGQVWFKNHLFECRIETETAVSHQHYCTMDIPSKKMCEVGDIILAVDYVLEDRVEGSTKIINGTASVIETKMELASKGRLAAGQLYLLTQWPKFAYGNKSDWDLDVFKDNFGFYFFVLDKDSREQDKSSVMSAPFLARLSNISKDQLIKNINQTVPFRKELLRRQKIGNIHLPLTFGTFLYQSLMLTFGSPSIEFRNLLRQFFPNMEEVEDCQATLVNPTNTAFGMHQTTFWDIDKSNSGKFQDDEDPIHVVRIKPTMKRIE